MPDDGRGTRLLDGNLLVALVVAADVHQKAARAWFGQGGRFATCPTVQQRQTQASADKRKRQEHRPGGRRDKGP